MKLVILAGGKGTRLGLSDIPKPMARIDGKPLLEHQIRMAREYGFTEIVILSGFKADAISDYFGDGSEFGVSIAHVVEDTPLGTAGSLSLIESLIHDRFMVIYGDIAMDFDMVAFQAFDSRHSEAIGTVLIHPNDHPQDSDLVEIDSQQRVLRIHKKPHQEGIPCRNLVNAALYVLSPEIFEYLTPGTKCDIAQDLLPALLASGKTLTAYRTTEYIKDMGTPDRLARVEADYQSGLIARKNLRYPQPAVFLDRDGVINHDSVDHILSPTQVRLIDGSADAIRRLNHAGYLTPVLTNQPAIAKGWLSVEGAERVQIEIERQLGEHHAFIDGYYMCPHHPESGFEGEVRELKGPCRCRKPETGLLEDAQSDMNIDCSKSWMVGDRYSDIELGQKAGLRTILVQTGPTLLPEHPSIKPYVTCANLAEAVSLILKMGDVK